MNKRDLIYELPIDKQSSILVYARKDYWKTYKDSELYIKIKNRKVKIVRDSFCYEIGANMYYRIHNVECFPHDFNIVDTLIKEWKEPLTSANADMWCNTHFNSSFVENNGKAMFLYKKGNQYEFVYAKLYFTKKGNVLKKVKIVKQAILSQESLNLWSKTICEKFAKRLEDDWKYNWRPHYTTDELQAYLESFKIK